VPAPRAEAERTIKEMAASGLLDPRRKVLSREEFVEIPVTRRPRGCQALDQDSPEFYRRMPNLAELLKDELTEKQLALIPRGWYILGGVIVVKIKPELEPVKSLIGRALLGIYPRCRCVLLDSGVEGTLREPVREVIAGEGTETIHKENGVLFKLDAFRIMFSPGNLMERMRTSRFGRDEFVVDMFAGIGYFALPIAVHSRPRKVLAIELNPLAYGYLEENVRLNHVQGIVQPARGDCRKLTPSGEADRVVMGYVGSTDKYLERGLLALRPGGVLHYHQTVPSWSYPDAAIKDVLRAAEALGLKTEILRCARVKKYSPGVVHAVVDARIGKN
jgi:tRNA wybutosine-synthesizing protein 2